MKNVSLIINHKSLIVKAISILLLVTIQITGFPAVSFAQEATPSVQTEVSSTSSSSGIIVPDSNISDPLLNEYSWQNQAVSSLLNQNTQPSAFLKKSISLRNFYRKDLKAEEEPTVIIDNANIEEISLKIFDFYGNQLDAKTEVINDQNPVVIKIHSSNEFKPGRYRVTVTDLEKNVYTQEFNWGVLAINTNKSLYAPGEDVSVQMAVLDQTGEMVCNSSLNLTITLPSLATKVLSSETGEIVVNPQCYTKDLTLVPDYQASFTAEEVGVYKLSLTATTPEGSYNVSDAIEVRINIPFDIERKTATRIYPPNMYPVTFDITTNQDFEGEIKEFVPESFNISKPQDLDNAIGFDTLQSQAITSGGSDVLGASIFNIGKPFGGDYQINLGFGGQHRDPLVGTKYTEFGVLGHDGVDFALPMSTAVLAADDGEVVRAGDGDYGTTIVIEHAWGKSYYGHLDKIIKSVGTKVKKGEIIALSGNSGLSSGPHLHFGIKPNKNDFNNGFYGKINPLPLLGIADEGEKHGMVAGVATSVQEELKKGTQVLTWKVNLKKGDKVTLGYRFNAPLISPELYLLGPLSFVKNNVTVFSETRKWQIAADAVVVNGGIVSSEAQFGGLQRKVAYVNSNWYAFYNDGTDIFWKKSADGITWGSANNLDASEDNDADNYNPSIDVSGNFIHVAYLDDSADQVQILTLDTTTDLTSQTTTPCVLASPGAFAVSTYMVSIASLSTTDAVVAYSDTSTGTNVDIFEVAALTSASCTSVDVQPGDIAFGTQGSGVTSSDRPVLVGLSSTTALMVYQDGTNLLSSFYDASRNEWRRNKTLVSAVTDTTYSIATDATNVWLLTQNSTTATRLFHYPKASTGPIETATAIDADIGGAAADTQDSTIDMDCISATDCKIVYTDLLDNAAPVLMFVDCDNADCSSNTATNIDGDVGTATQGGSPRITCPATGNCKIVYYDGLGSSAAPDAVFVDCGDATCSGTAGTCTSGTRTCTIVDSDLGAADTAFRGDVFCPSDVSNDTDCKFIFFNSVDEINDALWFADCSNANCSTRDALTSIVIDINDDAAFAITDMSLYCNASADCQVLFHDAVNGDLTLRDCSNSSCSTANATTDIDADVGANAASVQSVSVPNAIDCSAGATDCKIVYADGSQNEVNFVDCAAAGCTSSTITKLDDSAGGIMNHSVSLYCVSATDCKGTFVGHTAGGSEDMYFFDCDSATCDSGSVVDLADPPFMSAVDCIGGSTDCKIVYYDIFVSATDVPVKFADCSTEDCLYEWESQTAPWTSETNVLSVSLTYDSTNTDLIANIIKDASEQAYYSIADNVTTPSWATAVAYEFTAGDLDNLSSPETAAGTAQMGVLLRQGTNIEFDLLAATPTGPTMDQVMRHGKWFDGGVEQPFTF